MRRSVFGRVLLLAPLYGVACAGSGSAATTAGTGLGATGTTGDESSQTVGEATGDDHGTDGGDTGNELGEPPETTVFRTGEADVSEFPQYLAVRKTQTTVSDQADRDRCVSLLPELASLPFIGNAATCAIFNANVLDKLPDRHTREAHFSAGYEEVRKMVGAEHVGNRRLAVEVIIDLVNAEPERLSDYLQGLLDGARRAQLPIIINFDAANWWARRPDLWNFYDPAAPGYDPDNIENVEWINANPEDAPRVHWRNWGSQIRIPTPVPNLGSPRLRGELTALLDELLPKVRAFVDELPHDEQHLFGGVIIGTELAIGVNHYYYPNGNSYLADDAKCDPGTAYQSGCPATSGVCAAYNRSVCPPNFKISTSGGLPQLGYHAAVDLGLLPADGKITQPVLDAIVNDYIGFMYERFRDAGLPATKVFSHTGGTFGSAGPHSYAAAHVPGLVPGWSLYFGHANHPEGAAGEGYLETSNARRVLPWASPEWLPHGPNAGQNAWRQSLEGTLNYRNNRMVAIANWESITRDSGALAAVKQTLTTPASEACAVVPREVLGQADAATGVALRFTSEQPGTVTYLVASTSNALDSYGALAEPNVANAKLESGQRVREFAVPEAGETVWVQLVTDGCPRDGATQRMMSELYRITSERVDGSSSSGGTTLYASRDRAVATLVWDVATPAQGMTVEFARDASFADIEASADVTGATAFYRNGFDEDHPLYARLRNGASVSNTVVLR